MLQEIWIISNCKISSKMATTSNDDSNATKASLEAHKYRTASLIEALNKYFRNYKTSDRATRRETAKNIGRRYRTFLISAGKISAKKRRRLIKNELSSMTLASYWGSDDEDVTKIYQVTKHMVYKTQNFLSRKAARLREQKEEARDYEIIEQTLRTFHQALLAMIPEELRDSVFKLYLWGDGENEEDEEEEIEAVQGLCRALVSKHKSHGGRH